MKNNIGESFPENKSMTAEVGSPREEEKRPFDESTLDPMSERDNEEKNLEQDEQKISALREKIAESSEKVEDKNKEASEARPEAETKDERLERIEEETSFEKKFELLEEWEKEGSVFEIKSAAKKIGQAMAEYDFTRNNRQEFAKNIVRAIETASRDGRINDEFWEGFENVISVGSGYGENIMKIVDNFLPDAKKIMCIDPNTRPVEDISADSRVVHLGQKFEDVEMTARKGERNLVEASNFLQLFETQDKIEVLKKMARMAGVGGRIIIVDEIRRPGLEGKKDWALNRLFNVGKGRYERLDPGEYEELFEKMGLKVLTGSAKDRYDRGSVLFMLEVTEEAIEKLEH